MAPKVSGPRAGARCPVCKDKAEKATTFSRLSTWTRGVIWGMHLAELPREDMKQHVRKRDGSSVGLHAIDEVIAKKKENPEWEGTESAAGGRPRELSEKETKALVDLVFKERGKARVTIPYCKKTLKFLRRVHDTTVGRALHAAGLKWMTRRVKTWIPGPHKEQRCNFAAEVKRMHETTLTRWAYTDGTSFYLARGPAEHGQKVRAALGRAVWRRANGSDGLFDENIGPSLYAKAQGLPVKIWGFLANGRLEYWVLPADPDKPTQKTTNMTGARYEELVKSKFALWRRTCFGDDAKCHLVQDHEKCLWQPQNKEALRHAGCPVIEAFPKSSPDLNAIEGVWNLLRQRLEATQPEEFESRSDFLARLRRCAHWLNDNQAEAMLHLCNNQKQRATDVLQLMGAKTKW